MANASNGHFVWHEYYAMDPKKAVAFYSEVIGWKTQPFDDAGDYLMWLGSQGPLGGVMKMPAPAEKMGAPPHWLGSVQVANVDAATATAKKLGAKVFAEPHDIPTVGRTSVIADPQGAVIQLFTPNSPMARHDAAKEGEFCWNELMTTDSAAAFAFYAEVCGWRIVDEMDMGAMGTYRIFGVGDERLGGMMTIPKGAPMPPMWLYYTSTSDLDATVARAVKMGAKIMNGPMDIPGGARIAQLVDAQGAGFAIHEAPKK